MDTYAKQEVVRFLSGPCVYAVEDEHGNTAYVGRASLGVARSLGRLMGKKSEIARWLAEHDWTLVVERCDKAAVHARLVTMRRKRHPYLKDDSPRVPKPPVSVAEWFFRKATRLTARANRYEQERGPAACGVVESLRAQAQVLEAKGHAALEKGL
jgi:hypothetical protein